MEKQLGYNQYESLEDAMTKLYPGNRDIRCQGDGAMTYTRCGETDYECLKRLSFGYKKNTVFAFGLEGYLLKDIIGQGWGDHGMEPWLCVQGGGEEVVKSRRNYTYDPTVYRKQKDDYIETEFPISKYWTPIIIHNQYKILPGASEAVGPEFWKNYIYNKNLMSSKLYGSLITEHSHLLPRYKLGDTILYVQSSDFLTGPYQIVYLVSSMDYFISKSAGVKVTSVLRALEDRNNREEERKEGS